MIITISIKLHQKHSYAVLFYHLNFSSNNSLPNLGHTKFVELLIENGAKVNIHNKFNQFTPLHNAAESGHLETVKSLVEHGANVWSEDYKGQTPRDVAKSKFTNRK